MAPVGEMSTLGAQSKAKTTWTILYFHPGVWIDRTPVNPSAQTPTGAIQIPRPFISECCPDYPLNHTRKLPTCTTSLQQLKEPPGHTSHKTGTHINLTVLEIKNSSRPTCGSLDLGFGVGEIASGCDVSDLKYKD